MDTTTFALFVLGLALLVVGAELLVRGASRLASTLGISPLVIGLTVVAYGTSTPELAVSVTAGLKGQADIAVANVVGSNIFNVLFILGVSTMILPLAVAQQFVRREVPIMIGASLLFYGLAADGRIGTFDGCVLAAGIIAYTVMAVVLGRRESQAVAKEYDQEFGPAALGQERSGKAAAVDVALVALGLGLLVVGSRWLVQGAMALALSMGVSELVIGLTIVAAGTSLPEVAASIVATLRGERDIAVGNVVGSNIYNILAIVGISAFATDGGLTVAPSMVAFDMPVMIAVAVACLPIFLTGFTIARWEGGLFLAYYIAYTAYLIMNAAKHDALPVFSDVMLTFVLPLTGITLAIAGVRAMRGHPLVDR